MNFNSAPPDTSPALPLYFICKMAAEATVLDDNCLWDLVNELFDLRTKWKWIGLGLGIPEAELDAMKGSDEDRLLSMLSKWLKGVDPLPTWDALVVVLRSRAVNGEKKAKELEEKFCIVSPLTISDTGSGRSDLSPRSLQCMGDGAFTDSHPSVDDDSAFNSLVPSRARPSLPSALEKIADPEVSERVKQKDNQFRTLVRRLHRHVSHTLKQEGLGDFKVAISYLPASLHGHHILLSPEDRVAVSAATSYDQIFVVLNQYWTSVQYELLEYVVQEYGNGLLKEDMKAYIADFDKLEEEIGINHFTAIELCSPRPNSVAMEIHLSGSQHVLRNPRLVQQTMAEQCGLYKHTVRTSQITTGSTVLTLLIPYAVAGHVVTTFHGMLPAGELLSKPLEERIVYTMGEAETEIHLPMSASDLQASTLFSGRRERRGSGDSSNTASTGYETLESVGMVGESASQVAMLTSVLREREKEVEEVQRRIRAQSLSKEAAKEHRAVFILGSVVPHSNEAVVPQTPIDLSGDDRQVLSGLGLPPEKWDNLNALLALYNGTDLYEVFSVQVSKPGMELSRSYVLEQIEFLLKHSVKKDGGAVLHYYGNGRRNTGDWCFRDGFITFNDIASLYLKHSRGRVLTIVPDCHSSGHWVSECAKFLDEQGVRPCGHSAREKGILLKVYASCKTGQDAAELCYTTRAMFVKDDRYVYHQLGRELSAHQKTFSVDFTTLRCGKGEDAYEECSITSDTT